MARLQLRICGAAFVVLAISIPAYAHHGNAGYDLDKTVTLAGTVTGFDWVNPHCLVYVDVKENDGQVQHWTLELASPFTMTHAGWSTCPPGTGSKSRESSSAKLRGVCSDTLASMLNRKLPSPASRNTSSSVGNPVSAAVSVRI